LIEARMFWSLGQLAIDRGLLRLELLDQRMIVQVLARSFAGRHRRARDRRSTA
jgi:hypothetical protein